MPFLLHGRVRIRTLNQNVVGRFFHRVSLRSRAKRKTPEVRLSQVLRHSLARVVFAHRRAPPRPPHQGKRPANSLIADEITRILSAVGLQSFLGRTLRRTVALSHGMGDVMRGEGAGSAFATGQTCKTISRTINKYSAVGRLDDLAAEISSFPCGNWGATPPPLR